jgi:hypothetical protein
MGKNKAKTLSSNHLEKKEKKVGGFQKTKKNSPIFASQLREHSSVGLEHLPYKQRVRGSSPCAPTEKPHSNGEVFYLCAISTFCTLLR